MHFSSSMRARMHSCSISYDNDTTYTAAVLHMYYAILLLLLLLLKIGEETEILFFLCCSFSEQKFIYLRLISGVVYCFDILCYLRHGLEWNGIIIPFICSWVGVRHHISVPIALKWWTASSSIAALLWDITTATAASTSGPSSQTISASADTALV